MKCVICHQELPASSCTCPECGMSSVPELFLNPEQHSYWVKQIYQPAKNIYTTGQLEKMRGNISLLAAAGIDYYAWLDNSGHLNLEGFFNSMIGKARKWKKIKAIAAGAGHLAALFEDGTVSAVGKNTMEQCNTGDWNHVTQIAAAGDTTVAITEDGTLLSCGADAEKLKELSSRLKEKLLIREIAMSQTQIFLLASYQNKKELCAVCEYHRDIFQKSQGWSADVPEDIRITAGDSGCFMLRNGRIEAVNSGAESAEMAEKINHARGTEQIDGIAAGRENLFAFTSNGKIFCAKYAGKHTAVSFRLPFQNSESVLFNLLEINSYSFLAAVFSGKERQLLLVDISDSTAPVITNIS